MEIRPGDRGYIWVSNYNKQHIKVEVVVLEILKIGLVVGQTPDGNRYTFNQDKIVLQEVTSDDCSCCKL